MRLPPPWLRPLLLPAAWLYAAVVRARNHAFDSGRRPSRRAAVPVISVGNLTVGGTGKTPLVIELVRLLRALGRRPAVLTRGYRSHGGVSDEAEEIATASDVAVVVNPDRVSGATQAVELHGADVLVLDDGFQHRQLARDLDIVLIDVLDPWGGGWMLPAGGLREPRESLRRAQAIIVTRTNQATDDTIGRIVNEIRTLAPRAGVYRSSVIATRVIGATGAAEPTSLSARRVLPACGLGNPDSFLATLRSLDARMVVPAIFPDHHAYRPADVRKLARYAAAAGVDLVVTTRKDYVKLGTLWTQAGADAPPLVCLDVRLQLHDETAFRELLNGAVGSRTA